MPSSRVIPRTLVLAACCAMGCSGAGETDRTRGTGGGANINIGSGGGTGGSAVVIGQGGGSGTAIVDGCAAVSEHAEAQYRPQDIILVVDNSGSMDGEATAVQDRINDDLAGILADSGLDYRVILLSRYGKIGENIDSVETGICIGEPLGGHDCSNPSSKPGATSGDPVANTERFYHYSEDIDSTDAFCQILARFTSAEHADEQPGISSDGWQTYARAEAFKNFVVITDDHVNCQKDSWHFVDNDTAQGGEVAAQAFDAALLARSPEHFGTAAERNYSFYSIIGMAENTPSTQAWQPSDPITTEMCSANDNSVETPGTGYQALSILTGGLRYPICENGNFNAIFQAVAAGIIEGATLSCDWRIPPAPAGETFDRNKVNVRYTPSSGEPVDLYRVDTASDCGAEGGWYYDDPAQPERVLACPTTCDDLQGDATGSVDVLFGCETRVIVR